MIFNEDIEPCCEYCRNGTALGRGEFACVKHGIMGGGGWCSSFKYEPTKRVPRAAPRIKPPKLSAEDFRLNE